MNNTISDNRFELIEKAKKDLIESTNIETSEDEMKVLDSFLFRCWQMGWLDGYEEEQNELLILPACSADAHPVREYYSNNFYGKKRMVRDLAEVYRRIDWSDIADIELKKYRKGKHDEEFVVLTWENGAISTANNNMNSLSATARNVARMIDGGVYENLDYYKEIMSSPDWMEVTGETE